MAISLLALQKAGSPEEIPAHGKRNDEKGIDPVFKTQLAFVERQQKHTKTHRAEVNAKIQNRAFEAVRGFEGIFSIEEIGKKNSAAVNADISRNERCTDEFEQHKSSGHGKKRNHDAHS